MQPFAAFEWISEEESHDVLSMERRGPRLLSLLDRCRADVVCLQELQMERRRRPGGGDDDDESGSTYVAPEWIRPLLASHGGGGGGAGPYEIVLPPQMELSAIAERNVRVLGVDAAVTVAILYRTDRLKPVDVAAAQRIEGRPGGGREGPTSTRGGDTNTSVSICLGGATGSDLEDAPGFPVVVSSVHLDATDEARRVGLISRLLRRAEEELAPPPPPDDDDGGVAGPPSLVVAGDMNTELRHGSCVAALLRTEGEDDDDVEDEPDDAELERECASSLRLDPDARPSRQQLERWRGLRSDAARTVREERCVRLARADTGATRAAYDLSLPDDDGDEPKRMGQWRLDHVLYNSDALSPVGIWTTLEADEEAEATITGLPNRRWPSDHLPLGVLFRTRNCPRLSKDRADALIERIGTIGEAQARELKALEADLDARLAEVEARCDSNREGRSRTEGSGDSHRAAAEKVGTKKTKLKKRKGPPPAEVMDFMRHRRAAVKEMKAKHREDRRAVAESLDNLERLAIRRRCGYTVSEWIERG